MSTDFTYGEKQILISGPIKPNGKDMPSDARTRVDCYADIASIPNPYVGLKITVKVDETNNNKMTDYIVKSLKADSLGIANKVINEVVRYVDYLGINGQSVDTNKFATKEELGSKADKTELHSHINKTVLDGITSTNVDNWNNKVDKVEGKTLTTNDYTNEEKQTVASLKATVGDTSSGLVKDVKDLKTNGVSQDNINVAIENYLTEHPVAGGATTEQAAQIEANKTAIGDSSSGLIKEVNDIKNTELQNLNTAILRVNETVGNKSELPVGDENIIASINRIDGKTTTGNGLTSEQAQQLQTAYEHSQSDHVTMDEVNAAISNAQLGGEEVDTTSFATDLSLTGSNLQLKNSQGNLIGTSITLPTNSSSEITKVSELENDSGFINADYVGNKQIVYLTQAQFNALPTKSPECMYVVTDEEDSNSDGTTVNLTNYYTKSETNSTFATKTELNNLKLRLNGKVLSLYSGSSLLSSVDLSSLSSGGESTPVEVYGNIVPSLTTVSIAEGNETTVGITLDNAPTSEQAVNVSVNNSNCTVSPETLTFTSDNYSTSQNIRITGAHLSSVYTDQTSVITLSSLNVDSKLINVTITNTDIKPDTGTGLTRDNLVYYVDMKDQNWTKTTDARYTFTEDINTIFDKRVQVGYMEYTNGTNLDGNVIENNVLKSKSTNLSIYGMQDYTISGLDNKKITFEFFGKIPESATETMTLAEFFTSLFIKGDKGKDIGIYLQTSGGNLGWFDFSKNVVDYTQPHLFSIVLDQQDANLVYKLYSDGVEIASDTLTNKTLNNMTKVKILPQTRKGFEMGSLRIYNTALTAEQILANYNYETTIERVW